MSSKVLIIEFWNVTPHLETAVEIGMREHFAHNSVDLYFLGNAVPFNECYLRTNNKVSREIKFSHLTSDFINWNLINRIELEQHHQEIPRSFNSIPDLKRFTYKGYPVGLYVYCNLCDLTKLPDPPLEKNEQLYLLLLTSYLSTFKFVDKLLKLNNYSQVVTFNGRHINHAAVKDAANFNKIQMSYHERGGQNTKYWYEKERTHDVNSFQNVLKSNIKYFNENIDEEPIRKFVNATLNEKEQLFNDANEFSWDTKSGFPKLKIAYLASSVDEFEYFLSEPHLSPGGIWRDQRSAIIDLVTAIDILNIDAHLTVRLHPYEANKPVKSEFLWKIFEPKKNVTIIPPDSSISSYDVAKEADMIFLFHSSIAPDLLINHKKVYGMNGSSFDFLNSVENISTIDQLQSAISFVYQEKLADQCSDPSLEAKALREGLAYIYALQNVGHNFRYYESTGTNSGRFLGVSL